MKAAAEVLIGGSKGPVGKQYHAGMMKLHDEM